MPEPKFVAEEVWAVARALVEHSTYVDDTGRNAYTCCNYCNGSAYYSYASGADNREPDHDPRCPVLIARDLLTGAPNV